MIVFIQHVQRSKEDSRQKKSGDNAFELPQFGTLRWSLDWRYLLHMGRSLLLYTRYFVINCRECERQNSNRVKTD